MKSDISQWTDLIEQGIRYKENFGNAKRWHTYREYGRGRFPGYVTSTVGILPYNIVHSSLRSMVPNVYFRNPYVSAAPRFQPGMHMHSKIVESVDNWLIQELEIKSIFKTMVQDCFYTDRGIGKIGYDSLYGGTQTAARTTNAQIAELLNTPVTQLGKTKKERIEYNTNVKPGMPWVVRIMPDFFVVPFGVRSLDDCPWVDHIIIRSLDDVKNDPKYKNTKDLEGTHLEMLYKDVHRANFYKELSKYTDLVELHEIRDFKRKEIKVFAPGHDKWLRSPEEDLMQIEGLPFIDFTFNEDTEYYWGPSDVQIMEPQQLEVNETRTQAMLHRRIALVKFLIEENGMSPDEVDKMLSENVGPAVFTKGKPSDIVALLQPHIPADLTQWTEVIRSDVRELLGQSKQSMGEAPPGRRTKFEMEVVEAGHGLRMDERRDVVADALIKTMRKVNQVVFKKWTQERVAQVVGYDGARYWVSHTGTQLAGEYNLRVDVESMTPNTKKVKKREIIELIQALGNNPRANIDYLMRLLLREYEWIDAMQVLPEAPETMGGPMGQNEFIGMQNKMAGNPEQLKQRASNTANSIGRLM